MHANARSESRSSRLVPRSSRSTPRSARSTPRLNAPSHALHAPCHACTPARLKACKLFVLIPVQWKVKGSLRIQRNGIKLGNLLVLSLIHILDFLIHCRIGYYIYVLLSGQLWGSTCTRNAIQAQMQIRLIFCLSEVYSVFCHVLSLIQHLSTGT
jgi:hypothetical protein